MFRKFIEQNISIFINVNRVSTFFKTFLTYTGGYIPDIPDIYIYHSPGAECYKWNNGFRGWKYDEKF